MASQRRSPFTVRDSTVAAGRTDTGVHAAGQVVHFDTTAERAPRNWVLGANVNLPPDAAVSWALPVKDAFHARFLAQSRQYRYLILNRPTRSSLLAARATWVHRPLDAAAMHAAGQALVGTHDFSSYRAIGCQAKSPVRTLHSLQVRRRGELIDLRVHANAFLHHMVRNIAGVLIAVGAGSGDELDLEQLRRAVGDGVRAARAAARAAQKAFGASLQRRSLGAVEDSVAGGHHGRSSSRVR